MRTANSSLGETLFGSTRSRLLATLFDTPDSLFVRQIARRIDVSVGTVQRELVALAAIGIILRVEIGNQVFYRANRDHPVFAELHALLAKTSGVFQRLAEELTPLTKRIEFAFVYGSFARSDEKAESDIDLMVVGQVTLDELLEKLTPLERSLNRTINPTVYSEREIRAKLAFGNHFLQAIQKGKTVFLIGDELEFRELR